MKEFILEGQRNKTFEQVFKKAQRCTKKLLTMYTSLVITIKNEKYQEVDNVQKMDQTIFSFKIIMNMKIYNFNQKCVRAILSLQKTLNTSIDNSITIFVLKCNVV